LLELIPGEGGGEAKTQVAKGGKPDKPKKEAAPAGAAPAAKKKARAGA
jgi:hypothetical protein